MQQQKITPPYLFILNPNSGTSVGRKAGVVKDLIAAFAKKYNSEAEILFTEERAHATRLVSEHVNDRPWKAIVAVGGDGTINEIARPLVGTEVPVGILPVGSGNGLARHLGIPISLKLSLERLFTGKPIVIDSAEINEIPFFCTAGVGFDAYVGYLFSQQGKRGLGTYVNVSFQSYWKYNPQIVRINGEQTAAFSLSFANAGQFGNNAWIAPHASLQDGLLDLCTIKPFPKWYGTSLAYQLFSRKMKASRFISYEKVKTVQVETEVPAMIHYDGEPLQLDTSHIEVRIKPQSLRVIV